MATLALLNGVSLFYRFKLQVSYIDPVQDCRMTGNTIVPHDNRFLFPFDSSLEICSVRNMIVQEFQKSIAFFFLVSDDMTSDCF